MAEYVELYMDQGTDFSISVNLTDDTTQTSENISGVIVTSSLRKSLLSQNATANLVCTLTNPTQGEFTISLDSSNTANIREGRYFFDVKVKSNTSITRLIEGIMIVTPSITRQQWPV